MPKKKRKILVIGKVRTFDEVAWKRLIMAYAYYLHEQHEATDATTSEATAKLGDDEGGSL